MMAATALLFLVEKSITHPIAAEAGDRVLVRPGHVDPVLVLHSGPPNYGALAGLLADGILTPCGSTQAEAVAVVSALAQVTP